MARTINPYLAPSDGADAPTLAPIYDRPYAARTVRAFAAVIDGMLLLGATLPGVLVRGALAGGWPQVFVEGDPWWGEIGLWTLGSCTLFYVYQCYSIATTGQSLAKRAFEIRIVNLDGAPVGFLRGVVLRSWAMLALALIPGFGAIIAMADPLLIFGRGHRCLHDMIAGTVVVEI